MNCRISSGQRKVRSSNPMGENAEIKTYGNEID